MDAIFVPWLWADVNLAGERQLFPLLHFSSVDFSDAEFEVKSEMTPLNSDNPSLGRRPKCPLSATP